MGIFNQIVIRRPFKGAALVVPLSFFPTMARATFLSYFLILLNEKTIISVDKIGLFVGGFILFSSIFSLLSGSVLDSINLKILIISSSILQSIVYLLLLFSNSPLLIFILCLLLNIAYLALETAVRICITRYYHEKETASVLSIKYTFTNLAYALGPLAGFLLNRNHVSPLIFCSISSLAFMLIVPIPFTLPNIAVLKKNRTGGFFSVLAIMAKDHKLLRFTLSSIMLAGVFGQFPTYIGQYLLTLYSTDRMYEIINVVFVTNAFTSILLQYLIGCKIKIERFRFWICSCILAFAIGLIGFSFSSTFFPWILFTAIFTLGEIIIQPLEFFYISRIAPRHSVGAYYSSQNLTYFGAAATPIICGFILSNFNPIYFLLYLLTLLLIAGIILYVDGGKLT